MRYGFQCSLHKNSPTQGYNDACKPRFHKRDLLKTKLHVSTSELLSQYLCIYNMDDKLDCLYKKY